MSIVASSQSNQTHYLLSDTLSSCPLVPLCHPGCVPDHRSWANHIKMRWEVDSGVKTQDRTGTTNPVRMGMTKQPRRLSSEELRKEALPFPGACSPV